MVKNLKLLVALFIAASTVACSDDDQLQLNAIEVEQPTGAVINISPAEAKAGEIVTLTITVDPKFTFKTWIASTAVMEIPVENKSETTATIVMPNCPIKVTATVLAPGAQYGLTTVRIPAGTRMLGSEPTEPSYYKDEKLHQVTLSEDFYMSAYETTNAQYADFLNAVGVRDNGEGPIPGNDDIETYIYDSTTLDSGKFNFGVNWNGSSWVPAAGYENHPVIYVTWYGAAAYAEYVGGSLPTEAQWEYACRGGQEEQLPFGIGDGTKMVQGMAAFYIYDYYELPKGRITNFDLTGYQSSTYPVGSFEPNAWGLYDMHGNVYEWVSDYYGTYPDEPTVDPHGPATGSRKVMRGGGWVNSGRELRSAVRWDGRMASKVENLGFRVIF